MKLIHANKLYDTEKATVIHEHTRKVKTKNMLGWDILIPVDYVLYKTAKGNWFEVATKRDSTDKPKVIPLKEERVREIMVNFPDKYIELFGEVEEA